MSTVRKICFKFREKQLLVIELSPFFLCKLFSFLMNSNYSFLILNEMIICCKHAINIPDRIVGKLFNLIFGIVHMNFHDLVNFHSIFIFYMSSSLDKVLLRGFLKGKFFISFLSHSLSLSSYYLIFVMQ